LCGDGGVVVGGGGGCVVVVVGVPIENHGRGGDFDTDGTAAEPRVAVPAT
jgi:hypothetical protein